MNRPPHDLLVSERPVRSDYSRERTYARRRIVTVCVLVLLISAASYLFHGHQASNPADIPTIKAEGVYKQKPADPGGIDIPHQDVRVYDQLEGKKDGPPQVEHLLPPPETPLDAPHPTTEAPATPANLQTPVASAAPLLLNEPGLKQVDTTVAPAPAPAPVPIVSAATPPTPAAAEPTQQVAVKDGVIKVSPPPPPKMAAVPVDDILAASKAAASTAAATKPKAPSLDAVFAATKEKSVTAVKTAGVPAVPASMPLSSVVPAASVKPSPAPVADTPPAVVAKSSVAPKVAALSIEQVIENTKSSVASSRGAVLTASAQNSPAPQAAAATAAPASLPPPPAIAPTPQPALAAAAPAPAAKTSAPAQAGKTIIQLASVPDEAQAKTTLESLQHKYAVQLGGVSLHLARADLGTRSIFFRIQSQGLAEQDANRICSSLKQINAGCFLVRK